ncbi:MAG: PepSY-associated TM helix domain-containing protein [Burkholderiaceae bacterium]
MNGPSTAGDPGRARWLKTLHHWHWISSAISLAGMVVFAATGLTLNHATQIEAHPTVIDRKARVPAALLAGHAPANDPEGGAKRNAPLPADLAEWVGTALQVDVRGRDAEWSADEIDVSMPRPGGDAWLRIDRAGGEAEFEDTDRGWVSYLNDLHKGRHAGAAWSWFIDAFAFACLVFSVTGLFILKLHAAHRPTTWPLVGLGVALPALIALLSIH